MAAEERSPFPSLRLWSPVDNMKPSPSPKAETLMADIDAAITSLEHSRATALIRHPRSPNVSAAGLADDSYRAACVVLAAGRPDAAIRLLRVALLSCPPDKASAVSKIRSLAALASNQRQRMLDQQRSAAG